MPLFTRRERPPADIVALLERDERVVSWAAVEGSGAVLATPRGLWWPEPSGPRRMAWELIDKAVWRDGVLSVVEAEVRDGLLLVDRAPVAVRIETPRDLPPTVRKRVEASVVRSELHPVGAGAARFVGRRVPGRDGVTWWARLEPGTPDTPAVRAAVAARVQQLSAAWAPAE
jgi:hypothetical protein